jgi:hypothetical protein
MKTLGGSTFCWRGNDQDYHFRETIRCLAECCDQVSVVAGGPDGTYQDTVELVKELADRYPEKFFFTSEITDEEWNSQQGREKLSYFSNAAIRMLTTDWNFYLQSDEILTEESYAEIRRVIETGIDGVLVNRTHFWFDPAHYLTVPFERMPCGTQIVRLAKTEYRCIDDAESLHVPGTLVYDPVIDILHFGFVRDPVKHMTKIRNIQGEVFQITVDSRCDGMEVFDPTKFFSMDDVAKYDKPYPKLIQQWIKDRYPNL